MLSPLSVGYGGVSHMGVMCPGDGWLTVLYRLVVCRKLLVCLFHHAVVSRQIVECVCVMRREGKEGGYGPL